MNTFVGTIEGRLDEKGRIFIPAGYRKILAEAGSKCIVMRRDTDNECLMFYPEQVWNGKVEELRQTLDEWDPEDQLILMQFMADAEYMEMDGQGRILLQKKNLETISAQQDVLFVGMLNRFALWAPENFNNKRLSQTELAARLRAKMTKKAQTQQCQGD
ncbi:MAG: cell division/cell wall cluster transcriptional repressor MraZ [Paludibacteraceae bacterium]|nr:cell division/cell wall cluster transcriptional repressor MraZ [Paludibacteraceae bacterium]